jgi:hypothetical protein
MSTNCDDDDDSNEGRPIEFKYFTKKPPLPFNKSLKPPLDIRKISLRNLK